MPYIASYFAHETFVDILNISTVYVIYFNVIIKQNSDHVYQTLKQGHYGMHIYLLVVNWESYTAFHSFGNALHNLMFCSRYIREHF